jgi:1-acyl-sn-glycerol-3-phosphate acyltransferase
MSLRARNLSRVTTDPTHRGAGQLQDRVKLVMRPLARASWRFHLEGYERLPSAGPAILCPNHISFLDSVFVMLTVPRRISFVGKAEYMDSWKTKFLFPAMGMIPIDRSGGSKSEAALGAAEAVLRRGELFGIFPEGTRSRDGRLYKGHTGAARLAQTVGCPIYPVGVVGTREIQPPDAPVPKLFKDVTIRIGRPVRVARGEDRLVLRNMIDEVMFEIRELTGQEYCNRYATKEAQDQTSAPARVGHVSDEEPVSAELAVAGH